VGSAAAHRRKRQRSHGPSQHVRQAEVIYWTCEEPPRYFVIVIQVFGKTLNLSIIKMPEIPAPAEPYVKSRVFQGLRKKASPGASYVPTDHPNAENHLKAARTGGHFVSERAAKWAPIAGGLSVN